MQGNVARVFVLLIGLTVASDIAPELEPQSDKKFFGKDYPDDVRPKVKNHFGHPYPKVQDDSRYDKDYVKDENDDGGYWKAQMEYDRAKNNVATQKEQAKKAKEKEAGEEKELEKAEVIEQKAEQDANVAQQQENEAANDRRQADAAHDKVKNDLDESTESLEKEVDDLEECKKQLAAAKEKLKEALAAKEAAEKKLAAKEAEQKQIGDNVKDAGKSLEELRKAMEKEKAEHEAALDAVEKEKKEMDQAEVDLAAQANKLRKYRRADPDGGVYRTDSGAQKMQWASALFLAISAAYLP